MMNKPTDSPIPLIEFELNAFKNALALQSSSSNTKPLIRALASRLQLRSTLVGNYESGVVLIYPENYNRGEDQITLVDVIFAKSLAVTGFQHIKKIEPQPSTSSVPSSIPAALDLPTKKGDGGVESNLKPSTSSTKSFESGEQPPDSNVEQSAHGKQKGQIKWMESKSLINLDDYTLQSLSAYSSFSDSMRNSGTSSPPMNLEETPLQSLSDDPSSPKVTSTPQERTYPIKKPPEKPSWTEDWGSYEVILLPSGYMNNIAPELLSVLTDRVPGTVCYCNKHGQQLELPVVIYMMPPDDDDDEAGPPADDEKDGGRHSPTPGPSNRP